MIYCRAVQLDWNSINQERRKQLEASNNKENRSRITKNYLPRDQVLIVLDADERRSQPKLNQPTKGPYTITRVHTNGTVEIDRGHFVETINIHRLKPFYT